MHSASTTSTLVTSAAAAGTQTDVGGKARICKHVEAAARPVSLTKQMRQAMAWLLLQKRMPQSAKAGSAMFTCAAWCQPAHEYTCNLLTGCCDCADAAANPGQFCCLLLGAQQSTSQEMQSAAAADSAASLPADQPILVKRSFPKQQCSVGSMPECIGCGLASSPARREAEVAATAAAVECQSELLKDSQRVGRSWASLISSNVSEPLLEKMVPAVLSWDAKLKAQIREKQLVINKRRAQPGDTRLPTDRRAKPLFPGRKKQKLSPAAATAGEAHLVQYLHSGNSLVQAIRRTQIRAALLRRAAALKRLPAPGRPHKLVSMLCSMTSL